MKKGGVLTLHQVEMLSDLYSLSSEHPRQKVTLGPANHILISKGQARF